MKMQALVALKNLDYAKRKIKAGETFQVSPRDARILVALKRAQIDPAGYSPQSKPAAVTEELPVKEVVIEALGAYSAPAKKRSYTRRTTNFTTEG